MQTNLYGRKDSGSVLPLRKSINPSLLLTAMSKIVGKTAL